MLLTVLRPFGTGLVWLIVQSVGDCWFQHPGLDRELSPLNDRFYITWPMTSQLVSVLHSHWKRSKPKWNPARGGVKTSKQGCLLSCSMVQGHDVLLAIFFTVDHVKVQLIKFASHNGVPLSHCAGWERDKRSKCWAVCSKESKMPGHPLWSKLFTQTGFLLNHFWHIGFHSTYSLIQKCTSYHFIWMPIISLHSLPCFTFFIKHQLRINLKSAVKTAERMHEWL